MYVHALPHCVVVCVMRSQSVTLDLTVEYVF